MRWARGTQDLTAISDRRFADAGRHAENGLLYVPAGTSIAFHLDVRDGAVAPTA